MFGVILRNEKWVFSRKLSVIGVRRSSHCVLIKIFLNRLIYVPLMITFFKELLLEDLTFGLAVLRGTAITFQTAERTIGDILNAFLVVAAGLVYMSCQQWV